MTVVAHTDSREDPSGYAHPARRTAVPDEQCRGNREHRVAAREAIRLAVDGEDPPHQGLTQSRPRVLGPVHPHREREIARKQHDAGEEVGAQEEPQLRPGPVKLERQERRQDHPEHVNEGRPRLDDTRERLSGAGEVDGPGRPVRPLIDQPVEECPEDEEPRDDHDLCYGLERRGRRGVGVFRVAGRAHGLDVHRRAESKDQEQILAKGTAGSSKITTDKRAQTGSIGARPAFSAPKRGTSCHVRSPRTESVVVISEVVPGAAASYPSILGQSQNKFESARSPELNHTCFEEAVHG